MDFNLAFANIRSLFGSLEVKFDFKIVEVNLFLLPYSDTRLSFDTLYFVYSERHSIFSCYYFRELFIEELFGKRCVVLLFVKPRVIVPNRPISH
jgi:hypothetical protein